MTTTTVDRGANAMAAERLETTEQPMLTNESPEVVEFLAAWHEHERAPFEARNKTLAYDEYAAKSAHTRRRFIACDYGIANAATRCGKFLVDRKTRRVYSIKGYGVPNRNLGPLDELTARYRTFTAEAK